MLVIAVVTSAMGLAVAACTPMIPLEGHTGPCESKGLAVCPATGLCVTPSKDQSNGGGSNNGDLSKNADLPTNDPNYCPSGYTLRQGGTLLLAVPAATPEQTQASTMSDLLVGAPTSKDGRTVIPVSARPDAISGDGDFGSSRRNVIIQTVLDGLPVTRKVLVTVSYITVSPTGDDGEDAPFGSLNVDGLDGTWARPYATLARAAAKATPATPDAKGSTIQLSGFNDPNPAPCTAPSTPFVSLPSGITLVGADPQPSMLLMNIVLVGDANLQNVQLGGSRLNVTMDHSLVTLQGAKVQCGLTVSSAAEGADLILTARGQIWNDRPMQSDFASQSPLVVEAPGATVQIDDGAEVLLTTTSPGTMIDTIHFSGGSQKLTIQQANIQNASGRDAILIENSAVVTLEGAGITGPVEIRDPASSVVIRASTFDRDNGEAGQLYFKGHDMMVADSTFSANGIVQENAAGTVIIEDTAFQKYQKFGYKLVDGKAQINNSVFSKDPMVPLDPMNGPYALLIPAPGDGSALTSTGTNYMDVTLPLQFAPCEFMGPKTMAGLFSITDPAVKLDFH
jgi:hypothetical protein